MVSTASSLIYGELGVCHERGEGELEVEVDKTEAEGDSQKQKVIQQKQKGILK